ncbi:hypothetical protein AnigIFM63309_005850 [Aspergillus niger]|nr:hypothetical protein AnigIFM63309_005850 [Aspergillus niger]
MPSIPQLEEHLAKFEHDTEGRKGKNFKGSFASRRRVDPGIVVQNNGESLHHGRASTWGEKSRKLADDHHVTQNQMVSIAAAMFHMRF